MTGLAEVEQAVLDDEQALDRAVELLENGTDLTGWPEELRTALLLALADPAMSRTEGWKAVTLRRHLFGPTDRLPDHLDTTHEPSGAERRRAERLRAGLPALVRYRGGKHLLATPRSAIRADT
jgi:hypothetical protein